MLLKIPLLSFLLFGVTYPLCFWLSCKDPIPNNFQRFHLGCPAVIAGLAIVGLWAFPLTISLKYAALIWLIAFLSVVAFFWNRQKVNPWCIGLIVAWGAGIYGAVHGQVISTDKTGIFLSLLSGLIVSSIFYAMNLGHFYLNVHGLNIKHLKIATIAYAVLLALRLVWDIYYISVGKTIYGDEEVSLLHFMFTIDGFLLWVAIFFGTLFSLGASYFAFGTLKLKNTQATTGILYVLLSAVLLGDLAYKYYLLKFAIPL